MHVPVCVHVCVNVRIRTCICVQVWLYVKECVCMLECVYVCTYMCLSVGPHQFFLECGIHKLEGRNCLVHTARSVSATGPGTQKAHI